MTGSGPPSASPPRPPEDTRPPDGASAPSPAAVRAAKLSAGNMLRSLLPLVLICLAIVGWVTFKQGPTDPVTEVDPTASVRAAAEQAGYPLVAPSGLPDGYRPTSARTDAGQAAAGDPVTLEIGYLTPSEEFAGFVIGDDRRARPLATVLDDARREGTVELGGETWTRLTSARGETVYARPVGDATALVTGSAGDQELVTVVESLEPYGG
ncbi:DUF4245 domain-containing protein [Geodermatophilus sp. YIM 151500]|uniref:DUF4245 domain-containing protein n=1 Tax=Geodermatophilus sp. YIM 151500 TaxID=2984531 RepID=UPI0021E4D665|nr:DUF4245 domain-containing protein [Geodermatophilus sp. YIM 151500]MCV2489467.1 DUF4245 domain-containing protein [Geodermatophilus sp. YIM 151500]